MDFRIISAGWLAYLCHFQFAFPFADSLLKGFFIWGEGHALGHYNVVIQELRSFVWALQDVSPCLLIRHHLKHHCWPFLLHLYQSLCTRAKILLYDLPVICLWNCSVMQFRKNKKSTSKNVTVILLICIIYRRASKYLIKYECSASRDNVLMSSRQHFKLRSDINHNRCA